MFNSKTVANGLNIPKAECLHSEVRPFQYYPQGSWFWRCVKCRESFYQGKDDERNYQLLQAASRIYGKGGAGVADAVSMALHLLADIESREYE